MKARLIYNPTAGKEIIKRNLPDILNILENAGYEASAFATTAQEGSAKNEAKRAALAGFDVVIAAGGDGTVNEVVNGLAPLDKRPKMGVIPAGTTNDYARALKIPRDNVINAAKVIAKGQILKTDIGQANDNYFINIAAGGFLTELTYEVPSQLKTAIGYLAYLVKGAEMLPRVKPIKMKLEYDEGIYDDKASMFFLGLTNSMGGFEQIVPDAQLDDGKFSLIIVKTSNIIEIMHLIALMLNGGKHVNDPRVIYTKTSFLRASSTDGNVRMMINLDGDYGGDAPMLFTCHKQHIEMFANITDIPNKALSKDLEDYSQVSSAFVKEVNDLEDNPNDDLDVLNQ